MKKVAVLFFAILLLGLLVTPAVAQNQSIGWTLGSSNINSSIQVDILNENIAATGGAGAAGNVAMTGIENVSVAGAGLGIAGNSTENVVINEGAAGAGTGSAGAGQLVGNEVIVGSANVASVEAIVVLWP